MCSGSWASTCVMIYLHHLHLKTGGKPTFSSSAARLQDLWRHSSLPATATTHCSQLCAYLCLPLRSFLEKEMATYSSILAWRTSWIEEPGGLQSMGLQKVRHDRATHTHTHTHTQTGAFSVPLAPSAACLPCIPIWHCCHCPQAHVSCHGCPALGPVPAAEDPGREFVWLPG